MQVWIYASIYVCQGNYLSEPKLHGSYALAEGA